MATSTEESYNPYDTLHHEPDVAHFPQAGTQSHRSSQPSDVFLVTRKQRAWVILVIPTILLITIAGLLSFMLLWLLYHRVGANPSFGFIARHALVVDEAARWCQLLKGTIAGTSCDSNRAPTLLGLTFASLLVSFCLRGFSKYRQLNYFDHVL